MINEVHWRQTWITDQKPCTVFCTLEREAGRQNQMGQSTVGKIEERHHTGMSWRFCVWNHWQEEYLMHPIESRSKGKNETHWLSSSGGQSMATWPGDGYSLQSSSTWVNGRRTTGKIKPLFTPKSLCQPVPYQCFGTRIGSLPGNSYLFSWWVQFIFLTICSSYTPFAVHMW